MERKHAPESDRSWLHTWLTGQLRSLYASISSSVKQRFHLHQLGLDMAANSDLKKKLIPPIEKSRRWQPRICEMALINKVIRGIFCLDSLHPSHLKTQDDCWGTSLVVQWVRLCAPNAGGPGSIPGQGTRSHIHAATKESACHNKGPHMPQLKESANRN